MSKKIIEKYFSDEDLKKIASSIGEVEKTTSGEIRLCAQIKRGFFDKKKSPREIALKSFYKLGMHKTKDRTGVLIFLLLDERKFEILADEGINKVIIDSEWSAIEEGLISEFRSGNYVQGVLHCINLIGEKLNTHFPRAADDVDELSNEVVIK